jgi:hypothetical protein
MFRTVRSFGIATCLRVFVVWACFVALRNPTAIAQTVTVTAQSVGSNIDESLVSQTIYVDQSNPVASDANPGTSSAPLLTIAAGAARALANNRTGIGTKVLILPGTYRERMDLVANGTETSAPIVLQAQTNGSVSVAGSDLWTGWVPGSGGIYTHLWPYQWGLAPYPNGWLGVVNLADIVRRREMVFINGNSLTQVLDPGQLASGTFYVDERNGIVSMFPFGGVDPAYAPVEVSTRTNLLYISGMRNVVVRGLSFRNENSFIQQGGPLQILNSSNILVDTCQLSWNSTGGPLISGSDHVTVQQTSSDNNGFSGMAGYRVTYSLFKNIQTSLNNWRGLAGNFVTWDTAGAKFLLAHHDVFQGHTASSNFGPGFWLDTDNVDVLIQGARWTNNLLNGMLLEASEGPIQVSDSISANNGSAGLLLGDATGVTLIGNIFYGNQAGQIITSGQPGGRWVQDFETGLQYPNVLNTQTTLASNTVVSATASQKAMGTTLSPGEMAMFESTLSSDQNTWFNPSTPNVFQVANGQEQTLSQWQATTGRDLHSVFANPSFTNPSANNFLKSDTKSGRPTPPPK